MHSIQVGGREGERWGKGGGKVGEGRKEGKRVVGRPKPTSGD